MRPKIYDILAEIVADWNERNFWKICIVQNEGEIVITPVDQKGHLPGPVVRDVSMISEVYGFCFSIHSRNDNPFISI